MHSGFQGEQNAKICRFKVRCSVLRENTVANRKGDSQKPQDDCQGASAGSSIRGFCGACIECQGDGIKLVTGSVGDKSVPLGSTAAGSRWCFHSTPFARAIAGRRKKILRPAVDAEFEACLCHLQLPVPGQDLPQLSRKRSIVAATPSRTASAPCPVSAGAVLDPWLVSPWPCMRGRCSSRVNRGCASHERFHRLKLLAPMRSPSQCPGMARSSILGRRWEKNHDLRCVRKFLPLALAPWREEQ